MSQDPVVVELLKVGYNLTSLRDYIRSHNIKVKLSPKEFDQFGDIYSQFPIKLVLDAHIQSKGYQAIGLRSKKKEILGGIISTFRSAAKKVFLSKNKEVSDRIKTKAVKRAMTIAGLLQDNNTDAALYPWMDILNEVE